MFVELHMIQNFAPANLNRDDTNAPKDCDFGGYRRARISSQCIKRAIRRQFEIDDVLDEGNLGRRTKRLAKELADRLEGTKDAEEVRRVVAAVMEGAGFGVGDDGRTEYLLFLGRAEIDAVASLMLAEWEELRKLADEIEKRWTAEQQESGRKRSKKDVVKSVVPAKLKNQVQQLLDGGKAADLALFGRMIADLPGKNVDAACQVAHAISANMAEMEFDFYTAVDDLQPQEEAGAGMMGTIEFNSSCFYRYANIDFEQLLRNLLGKKPKDATSEEKTEANRLAIQAVEAFLRAAVGAVPTGKQNSMAAQNPPSFVLAVVRPHGLWSLANAFVKPVWPDAQKDLIQKSIEQLDEYWGRLTSAYCGAGNGNAAPTVAFFKVHEATVEKLKDGEKPNLDELVATVLKALAPTGKEAEA
jgi:CRISPR system Cascade subunit CasC